MSQAVAKVKRTAERVERRAPFVEHAVAMVQHYGQRDGSVLGGGITYFAYLSFFPVLALAFGVVGFVAEVFPRARDALSSGLVDAFPGIVRESCDGASGCIALGTFRDAAAAATLIGAAGLLYAGLGALAALRSSLADVLDIPQTERPNFVVGKLVDLGALVVLGVTLIVSVGLSTAVAALIPWLLDLLGLADVPGMELLFGAVGIALGVASSTALFLITFRLLAPQAEVTPRDRLQAALLAGAGFELLKLLAAVLVSAALGNPAFATLGVSLVLLVWMNYVSRLLLYGASWAAVAAELRAERGESEPADAVVLEPAPLDGVAPRTPVAARTRTEQDEVGAFVRGIAFGAGLVGAAWALAQRGLKR